MPLSAVGPSRLFLTGLASVFLLSALQPAMAQTPPETLRINVEPAKPGIRSVTINNKYRPIISRDDEGVVIDTMGSADKLPACDSELEVTLENSRVLYRSADLCSGGTLVVDVTTDGKPGKARVIGRSAESSPTSRTTPPATTNLPSTPLAESTETLSGSQPETPAPSAAASQGNDLLKPLDQVDISGNSDVPGSAPGVFSGQQNTFGNQNGGNKTEGGQSGTQDGLSMARSEARTWSTRTVGGGIGTRMDLVHGVPETDDTDFISACRTQSGEATIVFSQTSASTSEGITEPVQITAGDFSATYTAIGGSTNNQYGQSFPQVVLPLTDPLWQELISQSELTVQIQGAPAYSVSLKGSAKPVRLFAATCAVPQQILGQGDLSGSGEASVVADSDISCREAGRIQSMNGNRPGQIVFRNTSREAVDVNWIDYNGGERVYARLEPGQILEQQTYVSHAWIVRSARGQCLGIYAIRSPYREVNITNGASPVAAPQYPFGSPQDTGGMAGPIPPGAVGGHPGPSFENRNSASMSANGRIANYLCTAGVDLQVTFAADGSTATVAEMGQGVVTLPRQGGPSSFQYAVQGFALRGQLQNATWARPGLRDVFCAMR